MLIISSFLNVHVSSSSRLGIGNLVRRFFSYLTYKSRQQQQWQEGRQGEDSQQDDISTTISSRIPTTPTTPSTPSPQAGSDSCTFNSTSVDDDKGQHRTGWSITDISYSTRSKGVLHRNKS